MTEHIRPDMARHRAKGWWAGLDKSGKVAVTVALIALAGTVLAAVIPQLGAAFAPPKSGEVKVLDLVVRDLEVKDNTVTPVTAEILVHNVGEKRSVSSRLVVTVLDVAEVHACATEGEVAVSESYDLALPASAAPGASFSVPISQQQAADEADRFDVRLGVTGRLHETSSNIYRLTFELVVDGSPHRVPAGTAIVALPDYPDNETAAYYWGKEFRSGENKALDNVGLSPAKKAEVTECMKRNSAILQPILALPGESSPGLARVRDDL